jgi:hypothetical protein
MSRLAILGGPGSGKTTFLSALSIELQENPVARFKIVRQPKDARTLERLEEPLLDGRYPVRTSKQVDQDLLELTIRSQPPLPPLDVDLEATDYAGEQVERLFEKRHSGWSDAWKARAQARGILLFIRPPEWVGLPRLVARQKRADDDAAPSFLGKGLPLETAPTAPEARPGDAVKLPTELAVIELLQFLREVRGMAPAERPEPGTLRVGVLISAWDALPEDVRALGPREYVRRHAALLDQFLWSNHYDEDVQFFGLSATGGDLNDPDHRARYNRNPEGYVTWSQPDGTVETRRDLTLPLAWALLGDDALR